MKRKSPGMRWNYEHRRKIAHRTLVTACLHALHINLKQPYEQFRYPYPCLWGRRYRDGEVSQMHWHIGRKGRWES